MSELKAIESATAVIEKVYLVYRKSEADKVICHNKYKRCLAMAKWCESEAYIHEHGSEYDENLVAWFGKWYERWLKIAKKFNEEK